MLNQPFHKEDNERASNVSSDVELVAANPFPGLRPFSIDDTHLFFGREHQIDDILLKISKNRFITIMGCSGSGKGSFQFYTAVLLPNQVRNGMLLLRDLALRQSITLRSPSSILCSKQID
jgi:ABC-type histidine transport system ATPase subunit